MKLTLLLAFLTMLAMYASGQTGKETLYLKNGSVIKGIVLERTDSITKIKTRDGNIFVYPASQIQQSVNKQEARWDSADVRAARRHRRVLVGFSACPLTSLWNFQSKRQTDYYGNYEGSFQYAPAAGFVGGFSYSYYVGNVGFESGLVYMTDAIYYSNLDIHSSFAGPEKQFARYHNLRLPLLFTAATKDEKVRFVGSIGVSADFMFLLVQKDNIQGSYTEDAARLYPAKNANYPQPAFYYNGFGGYDYLFGLQGQIGVEANLASKVMVRLSPAFYYSLPTSVSGGIDVKVLFKVKGR